MNLPLIRTFLLSFLGIMLSITSSYAQRKPASIYAKDNLVAWCIVPFDSKNRGPVERAEMLNKLGITRLAYDWREKHIPTFDEEIEACRSHHIKLEAFWMYSGPNPEQDQGLQAVLDVLKRKKVKTQIWLMIGGIKNMNEMSQEEKIKAVARPVQYVVERAAALGCTVGLYNHGGWFGEPENQLAVIDYLKKPNLGMVYNFHHAEEHIERFPQFFPKILPHLLALNLAGLKKGNPVKVVPIGDGDAEQGMMEVVKKSGYKGPIGIINEDTAPDAEVGLTLNMKGLQKVLQAMNDRQALKSYQ
ncbi:TIM barrel protein [Siphonobacter sp. SORGH_AS_0500]|uniref:sugar phosphate isomerase/epimerase family protein n=1 Tax=Siphonobacter sp. SORGH_AS_0500 TaxID=1864824 RepID=UPI00285C6742|nr:TIM barrel protein [Siphonobacter sp. SORGH_AS_0500]MDR6197283.1 sugar phosphate isomerase/epimerase [Siphonobacter sp. SORGH_AS_0500]